MATSKVEPLYSSTYDNFWNSSTYRMEYDAVLAAAIFEIIISLVGTVGNLFTIIAVLRNHNLQYATNYFIVSLSVADTLVCTILVPMRASQHISYQYDDTIPKTFVEVAGFVGRVNIIASISTLVCLSIDRYLALSKPLKYATSIRYSLWKVLTVIAAIWILAIFITSLPKFPGVTDKPFLIFFVVFVLTATFVICVTYYRIFRIIAKNVRKMGQPIRYSNDFQPQAKGNRASRTACKVPCKSRDSSVIVNASTTDSEISKVPFASHSSALENKTSPTVAPGSTSETGPPFSREERKAAKTVGIVIAAFIVLVYPRIIMIMYHFGNEETPDSKVARFWMRVLLYANSAVNPTFYAFRHKGFSKEFKRMGLQWLGLGRAIRERYSAVVKKEESQSSTFYV